MAAPTDLFLLSQVFLVELVQRDDGGLQELAPGNPTPLHCS
jgi:hypothetical protein